MPQPQQMIELLEQQKLLYGKLKQLSEQQHTLVAEQNAEQLLGILGARQKLIEQLTVLNQQITPLRQAWTEVQVSLDETQKTQVNQLVEDAQKILEQIMAADEQDRVSLKASRDQLGGKLQKVSQGGAARQAYHAYATTASSSQFTNQQV